MIELTGAKGTLKKISNNILKFGEADVWAFTLPIEGIAIERAQIDALCGAYTFLSWFNQRKDGAWEPMGWWAGVKHLQLDHVFHVEQLELVLSGRSIVYESDEGEDGESIHAATISRIRLKAVVGGIMHMSFHVQVKPDLRTDAPLLLEHQRRPIEITLGDLTLVTNGKDKQQDLGLQQSESDDGQAKRDEAVAAAGTGGNVTPIDGTTAKSRARKSTTPAAH